MSRKKIKGSVVIAGYFGFGNAGDELLLLALIRQIRNQNPVAQITVLSNQPEQTAQHFGVQALNRWHPWQWLGILRKTELFLLGGGGLLQESTGPWNYAYYLSLIALAKLMGCRTEIRAAGVDPINRWWNALWTRFTFNHLVDYVSVRDVDSQRALEMIGVFTRLWRVMDPVFHLELPKSAPVSGNSIPRIAWAMAPWPQRPGWDHDLALLLDQVGEQLHVTNELLVFFPEQDEALARKVSALSAGQALVRAASQPEDLLSWVPEYDLIIGMRYHALVLAAMAEKPFIGWGYQRKVRSLCHDFDQPVWTFERGWDAEAVFRQIGEAWRKRDVLPARYRSKMTQWISAPPSATDSARIFVPQA